MLASARHQADSFGNSFLAPFYNLLGHTELESDLDGRRKYHAPAPCTLGSCYGSGRRMVGNLGFAFEENVLGGRLVAPVAATNTFYANPLIIMENVGSLSARKFYCVDDEIVRTALHWARASRRATVKHMLLHDERNTMCAEQCCSMEIGVKRCNTSPTLAEPPLKKRQQEATTLVLVKNSTILKLGKTPYCGIAM
eukprot:gene8133-9686_t